MKDLEWTGERLVTSLNNSFGKFEHLHRYALASEYIDNKIVLDIASGEGYGTNLLSQKAKMIYGVDISEDAVIHAQKKYQSKNIEYRVGSVVNIPFENEMFDVVISFETIEHVEEQTQMLSEIKRVLKKDGILILSSPEKDIYMLRDPDNKYHVKELSLNELICTITAFFKNHYVYEQKVIIGSLIVPIEDGPMQFKTYDGDYYCLNNTLKKYDFFNQPFFNILICSDKEIDKKKYSITSFFNSYEVYENVLNDKKLLQEKINSKITVKIYRKLLQILHLQ